MHRLGWALADELGPLGIRVNAVAPGAILGEGVRGWIEGNAAKHGVTYEEQLAAQTEHMALRRIATEDEVANAVLFLASDLASGITGATSTSTPASCSAEPGGRTPWTTSSRRSSASTTTSSSRRTCGRRWLPAKYRDRRPARRAARHRRDAATSAAAPTSRPSTADGPPADCWVYEDLVYIHKRHVAAVGLRPRRDDACRRSPTTRCARAATTRRRASRTWTSTRSRRRCASRRSRASAARRSSRPRTTSSASRASGVQRLDGRGVVRRLRRPAHPADHHPAVGRRARRRRGAPQRRARRARGVLQRDPAVPRPAVDPLRRLGPVLRGVRTRPAPSSACTSARRRRCRRRRPTRPPAVGLDAHASTTPWRR